MRIILLGCLLSFTLLLHGQDPLRFEKEVNELVAGDSAVNKKKLILFTGSSSIRFWKSLKIRFSSNQHIEQRVWWIGDDGLTLLCGSIDHKV